MRGHKGAAKDDKSIMTRLTPELVLECGGIKSADIINSIDVTTPSYNLLYRIWGNHQKLSFQNKDMGYLKIQKVTLGDKLQFRINKLLVNYDNLNLHLEACLNVKNDKFNTPLDFSLNSYITDNALCKRPELSLARSGSVNNNHVVETIKQKEYQRLYKGRLIFDFTVYDLVFRGIEASNFTYYENLYSFKKENKLFKLNTAFSYQGHKLSAMVQLGTGLTERIFYRDKNGIPIIMIQNSVVYILDPMAIKKTETLMEELNTGGVHYEY